MLRGRYCQAILYLAGEATAGAWRSLPVIYKVAGSKQISLASSSTSSFDRNNSPYNVIKDKNRVQRIDQSAISSCRMMHMTRPPQPCEACRDTRRLVNDSSFSVAAQNAA